MSASASRPLLVLSVFFAALPFVILFVPSFIVFCLIGALLATPRVDAWREVYKVLRFSPITRAVALLLIWTFATTLWADEIRTDRLIELAALCALGLHLLFAIRHLSNSERRMVAAFGLVSFFAATVLFLLIVSLSFLFPVGVNWNPFDVRQSPFGPQSAAAYVALCWPLVGFVVTGRIKIGPALNQFFVVICLIGLTVGFFRLSSLAGLISIAFGGVALLAVSWRVRTGVTLISALSIGYLLLAPTIHIWPSAEEGQAAWTQPITHELSEWHANATKIFAKPIFGYGFDALVPLQSESVDEGGQVMGPTLSPPGNLFLLVWLELGMIGAILFAGVMSAVALSILRIVRGPIQAAVLVASAMSILAPAVLAAGSWSLFWIASSWCVGAAGLLLNDRPSSQMESSGYNAADA